MSDSIDIIDTLVDLEWEAFQLVNNEGGRAACQDDRKTFVIMRKSQFLTWSGEMLNCYWHDLLTARDEGRNLLAEKYARMMQYTAPEAYAQIEELLPERSAAETALVDEICAIQLAWHQDFASAYPRLASRGRPLVSTGEHGVTSCEIYLRGELLTYSLQTLTAYAAHVRRLKAQNVNMNLMLMNHMVGFYGHASLEQAEAGA